MEYIRECSISPDRVLAGDSVEFKVRIVAGVDFRAQGTRLILDHPAYLGTDRPSRYDQEDGGYVEVFCSNAALVYECRPWDMEVGDFPSPEKTSFKGMAQRLLVIDFSSGDAREGDEIIVKWGWTRNGFGIGCKVPTIVPKPEFVNTLHIRYFVDGTRGLPDLARSFKGYERPVPDAELPVHFTVLPREPESARLIHGHCEDALLVHDRFYNICPQAEIPAVWKRNERGVAVLPAGLATVDGIGLPLRETPVPTDVFNGLNIYFGDFHNHSAFSNDCIEREKQELDPGESFRYARDVSRLDFLAVTDHHQPWDQERNKIGRDKWEMLAEMVAEHNRPGTFLAFPGFEFRCARGDTAVVFSAPPPYAEIDRSELGDIRKLWDAFTGLDYITIPHFHNGGGLPENVWWECPYPGVETMLEIYSCHGAYDVERSVERRPPRIKYRRPDRNGKWLLDHDFRYGLCANSDGHKGNPGANGLTAIFAAELTSAAIFAAVRKRHVYGTTNARIRLLFTADGQLMGSTLAAAARSEIGIQLAGEAPFKSVEFYCNGALHRCWHPFTQCFSEAFDIVHEGPSYCHVRAVQMDNEIAWSSPIWFD